MLTLTQSATLYRRAGQRGGKPAYETQGTALRCRIQPGQARADGARGLRSAREALVFTEPMEIGVGDRLVTVDGAAMVVNRVEAVRGFSGTHHLEIEVSGQA